MKHSLIASLILFSTSLLLHATETTSLLEEKALGGDASAALNLAKYYEAHDDKDRALLWYKHAATLSIEKTPLTRQTPEPETVEQLQKIERTEAVYGSFLRSYDGDDETKASMKQMLTKAFDIAPYKINYLLPMTYDAVSHDDRKHAETKFQLSLQKGLSDNLLGLHESFVVAYTQTSWWQTTDDSAPFRETNYQPEIFMIMPHFSDDSFIKAYQIGVLHESNGQGGDKSRSWNRVYAKTYLQAGNWVVSPRIWYRIPEDANSDDNHDIDDYLGIADLELMYPWKEHTFKILLRNNFHREDNRGAVQADWTFPLWEKNLFGYIQLYSGYAESLIDYNKRSDRVGIGFALSR